MSILILDHEARFIGKVRDKRIYSLIMCDNCSDKFTLLKKKALFNSIHLCNLCSCGQAHIKKTINDYIEKGLSLGFKYILDVIPQNTSRRLDNMWSCRFGHTFFRSYNAMNPGAICNECKIQSLHQRIDELLQERGYSLAGQYPQSVDHLITLKCNYNHVWQSTFYHLTKGSGCHYCNRYYKVVPGTLTEEELLERRCSKAYDKWRSVVHENNDFTCQICFKRGGILVAHHLNSFHWDKANRLNPDNGVTLCQSCHREFHSTFGMTDNTREQFIEFLTLKRNHTVTIADTEF